MVEVVVLSRLPPQWVKNLLCNSGFSNQTLEKEGGYLTLVEKEQNKLNIERGRLSVQQRDCVGLFGEHRRKLNSQPYLTID